MPLQFNPFTGTFDVTTKGDTGTVAAAGDGTAAAPGITFASDTNTGIYRPGEDQLALSTNGTGRLFVDASGNVGLGGATDKTQGVTLSGKGLTVQAAGAPTISIWDTNNASNYTNHTQLGTSNYIWNLANGPLIFGTNNAERLRITSAGLVGIGTSAPRTSLDLGTVDSVLTIGPADASQGLRLGSSRRLNFGDGLIGKNLAGSPGSDGYITPGNGSGYSGIEMRFGGDTLIYGSNASTTAGASVSPPPRLIVKGDTGAVGIGTTSPSALLTAGVAYGGTPNVQTVAVIQSATNTYVTVGAGSSSQGGILFADTAANNAGGMLYSHSTDSLEFLAGGNEAARIDSSRRLLVGTSSSPSAGDGQFSRLVVQGSVGGSTSYVAFARNAAATAITADQGIGLLNFTDNAGNTFGRVECYADANAGSGDYPGRLVFSTTADGAASPTERMRINNAGKILINQTSTYAACDGWVNVTYTSASTAAPTLGLVNASATAAWVSFSDSATVFGSITRSGSSTVYATSSDYRLKENVVAVTDGITRLQQLKPSRFNFIADPDKTVDGFIAHEVQTIVPEAITGEKDAVDDEGNPIYQGIDQSKLVPLLTAALQEAVAKIESLEARLTAAGI